jgi:hypothetical protein
VTFGVHAKDRLAVLKQDGGRMPDVLAGFTIHDDDALRFLGEIDEWDGIGRPQGCGFGGAGQSTAQGRKEQESIHKVLGMAAKE